MKHGKKGLFGKASLVLEKYYASTLKQLSQSPSEIKALASNPEGEMLAESIVDYLKTKKNQEAIKLFKAYHTEAKEKGEKTSNIQALLYFVQHSDMAPFLDSTDETDPLVHQGRSGLY